MYSLLYVAKVSRNNGNLYPKELLPPMLETQSI